MNQDKLITIVVFFFAILITDGILLAIIFVTRQKVKEAAGWTSTMGTVLLSTIQYRRSNNGTSAYPVVQYSYEVLGRTYQGNKIMPGPEVGGSGTHKIVARYPMGAQVMVYYDPNAPSNSVLERDMPGYVKWLWIAIVLGDLFMCGIAIVILFFT